MSSDYDWYDLLHQASDLVEEQNDLTVADIAREIGIPPTTLRGALKRELGINSGEVETLPDMIDSMEWGPRVEEDPFEKVTYKFGEDGSKTVEKLIMLTESEMNDRSAIMRKMGLDPIRWDLITLEMERGAHNVTMKLSQGSDDHGNKLPEKPHTETNYLFRCKIRVQPLQDKLDQEAIRSVFEELSPPELTPHEYEPSDFMLELGIYDPHFGKHAWEDETGKVNYDLEIADETFRAVVSDLVARVQAMGMEFDKVLLPVGQDFYHIDSKQETTTSGTQLSADDRWQKIYQVGLEALIWTIEEMRRFAPVEVMYVPGNHDEMMSFFATLHLDAYYRDMDDVNVNTLPTMRKYYRYGNNLIGFSHGKEGKRLKSLMQVEVPEDWGETLYREYHLGDLHHEKVEEEGGIVFRRLPSISATDDWHAEKGYMGALRRAQAFVWDREQGLAMTFNLQVPQPQDG